jgi:hypothetical protein
MATIAVEQVIAAARALMRAGCWELAGRLLAATETKDHREQTAIALAMADVAVDQDYWCRTGRADPVVDLAVAAVAQSADSEAIFDLDLLRLRQDYVAVLFDSADARAEGGPADRDPAVIEELSGRADGLCAAAPDRLRGGLATCYAGMIAGVLRGDAATGGALFAQALAVAELSDDEPGGLLASCALRHLGAIASKEGDADRARDCWERSVELRQRARFVPGSLALLLALAELADGEGDNVGAGALAGEVRRWAGAIGLGRLKSAAAQTCEPPGADGGAWE